MRRLTGSGSIQVGFFNQSKNLNRQVPLFELAEESKPGLEIGAGQSSTLKVRINDLSSHHQNQRFIIVIGPADAPIRGSRSVPIEIMSKPRVDSEHPATDEARLASKRSLTDVDDTRSPGQPPMKRAITDGSATDVSRPMSRSIDPSSIPLLSALAAVTDPSPSPKRKVDLAIKLLEGFDDPELVDLYDRLGTLLKQRGLGSTKPATTSSSGIDIEKTAAMSEPAASSNKPLMGLVSTTSYIPAPAPSPEPVETASGASSCPGAHRAESTLRRDSTVELQNGATPAAATAAPVLQHPERPPNESRPVVGHPTLDQLEDLQGNKPRKFQPLVKAMLAFRKNARDAAAAKAGNGGTVDLPEMPTWVSSILEKFPADEGLNLSEEQLREFFVDESSGGNILEAYSGLAAAAPASQPNIPQRPIQPLQPLQPPQHPSSIAGA